ncbi:hypothetical protein KZX46_21765 (plasmid) [Polymorphobacter sp. PAMC 29334]|uniref:hypothetical protein n=1 Tax=Polymorphobacter sp. PAMC 29334 TaxID=2862331 RepID=UPI001C77BFEB|nr:hypothetical protein [Polymorphobacter sp. PAMC 29334]QYE37262.1 hypothetical protein KZX46_21765 [Polymorphobacter sp. PAMC 29334]
MSTLTFTLGPAPYNERCAQTRVTTDWLVLQQLEATTYRAALIAVLGPPPADLHMPVVTFHHDFGGYACIEVRYPSGDVVASVYADKLAADLKSWMAANFTAPVLYDDRSQPLPGSRRTAFDCIVDALATCHMLIAQGYGTEREEAVVANLTRAYPGCARMAAALVGEAAGHA